MGRAYQVQFKTDLSQTHWINLGSKLTATDATMTTIDSAVSETQRFYRIELVP